MNPEISDTMAATARRLVCDTAARQGLLRAEVGDLGIKESRRRRVVPAGPGGLVGDYVPFYFAPRSPMLYRIACDHRDTIAGRYADGDRPLVYLAATVGAVIDAGLNWVATDGNAATATTEFSVDLARLDAPGSADAARELLAQHPDDLARVESLLDLVDGFETPYSLELLATVHFASIQQPPTADSAILADRVAAWSLRKARLFTERHVHVAAARLNERGLLPA